MRMTNPFARSPKLNGKRVLVVEDEALVSMLVEDELRDAGATVLGPAACVEDAMRLIDAVEADGGMDAAVLDINLAGLHVGPVADRLAALGVPFVFATGYGEGRDAGGHGAAPVMEKPFDTEMLVAAVETLASPRRDTDAVRAGRGGIDGGGRFAPDGPCHCL